MGDHTYRLRYSIDVKPGKFEKRDGEAGRYGLTDGLVLVSILWPEDGSYSQVVLSNDGRGGGKPLPPEDLWKVWIILAAELTVTPGLSDGRRALCRDVHERVREVLLGQEGAAAARRHKIDAQRAAIVRWIRGAPERMKKTREGGAYEIGPLHTAGMLAACEQIASAIEAGEHLKP